MKGKRQVWVYQNSRAKALVQALRGRYSIVELPPGGKRSRTASLSRPPTGGVVCLAVPGQDDLRRLPRLFESSGGFRLILVETAIRKRRPATRRGRRMEAAGGLPVFARIPLRATVDLAETAIRAAFESITAEERERAARLELKRAERETEQLNRIGVALSAEKDVQRLFDLILQKAREISGADAGSLYLIEGIDTPQPKLRFKHTQNASRPFPFSEFQMPLTDRSMAGYVALHAEPINLPDAYAIPRDKPYRFNARYDEDTGYMTRSVLTVPMKNAKGETLGVLQLINCKRHADKLLLDSKSFAREVRSFPRRAERLAMSLASQAAVAYENSHLYSDIESLFEGFVKAAVLAIEQRDPTTSGHSFRVSTLTVGLAETVDRADTGVYAKARFTPEQMKEIRYAALLHDFGKVGVREEVLVKAKKLYPLQFSVVQQRFDYIRKELEARTARQKLEAALERSREEALQAIGMIDAEYERQLIELDGYFQSILSANEPTVLPAGKFDELVTIARRNYSDPRGVEHPYLTTEEVRFLSIPKGSLDSDERLQIESHVVHTFNFLNQIPWTREIKSIPWIARAHHEKLNGSGYPYKLKDEEIPLQAKMMTVCDIFDALSAADRPYKKAVPVERALDILAESVKLNELDPILFQLFVDAKIFQLTMNK